MKRILHFSTLAATALFFASCAPIIIERPATGVGTAPHSGSGYATPAASSSQQSLPPNPVTQTVTSQAQKEARERAYNSTTTPSVTAPALPAVTNYPVALPIPGRPGFVYNPYNNNPVYVQGVASGKVVIDPNDPKGRASDQKFRIP